MTPLNFLSMVEEEVEGVSSRVAPLELASSATSDFLSGGESVSSRGVTASHLANSDPFIFSVPLPFPFQALSPMTTSRR
jgi:hypothetical protein